MSLHPRPIPRVLFLVSLLVLFALPVQAAIYYVSSATGNDADNGLSPADAFRTLAHVSTLALLPGDQVRLFCGEIWRADPLIVTRSGSSGSPITFTSHPLGCANQPVISGAWPVTGFSSAGSPNLWVANLDFGANLGKFPSGARQVFRGATRLGVGRWPNLGEGPNGDGYATIDSQPAANRLQDAGLPAGSWIRARVHTKGIRWYILNREVSSQTGTTLVLNDDLACIGTPNCAGWGYFLTAHLLTLDREGEWYWDPVNNRLFLFSATAPADGQYEATTVTDTAGTFEGGIVLGRHLEEHVNFVTIENLRIERTHDAGITFPQNLEINENQNLVIRGNTIVDVEGTGLRLATFVWNGGAGSGWRGGSNLLVENNLIEGANQFGIDAYSSNSIFRGNVLRDIGRIEEISRNGIGCGITGTNCTENGDGFRLNLSFGLNAHDNQIVRNTFENIGMNGLDVFGNRNTIEENVFADICITKGDCGAIRTFGRTSLASTQVYDNVLRRNVIEGVEGNTDGCHPTFAARLGIGLYLDNFSRNLDVVDNTVAGASWVGLLFQNSTGSASGNVLYGNAATQWGSQLDLRGTGITSVELAENEMVALDQNRFTLTTEDDALLTDSDFNVFWNPFYPVNHIRNAAVTSGLAGWRTASGLDAGSIEQDYTQAPGQAPRTLLLVNPSAGAQSFPVPDGSTALDGTPLASPVSVAAFRSQVVVTTGLPLFQDGFESGGTTAWSSTLP